MSAVKNLSGVSVRAIPYPRLPVSAPAWYRGLQLVSDVLAVLLAWQATWVVRLALNPYMEHELARNKVSLATPTLVMILALWVGTVCWFNIYRRDLDESFSQVVGRAFKSAITVGVLTILVTFFFQELGASVSRSFVLLVVPTCTLLLVATSAFGNFLLSLICHQLVSPIRIAVVGSGHQAQVISDRLSLLRSSMLRVVGVIVPGGPEEAERAERKYGYQVLGNSDDLAAVINRERIDRLVLSSSVNDREVEYCNTVARRMGITISRIFHGPTPSDTKPGAPVRFGLVVEYKPVTFSRGQEIVKRVFDLLFSSLLLLILAPVFAAIALAIKFTSPGPVLYKSVRVGKGGRYFTFLKFRSMYFKTDRSAVKNLNERSGHLFKVRNDPRITPVGNFLRRYSLDELPQLWNVIRGDMSLLGPRPLPAEDLDPDGFSKSYVAWAEQRARVLPGITGLWQVRGRSELSFEEMMELDIHYIRHWSLILDLKIVLATPKVVVSGKGAY